MFNKNILEELNNKRIETSKNSSPIKRMFVEGKFNRQNYLGGDDIIRDFFNDIEDKKIYNTMSVEEDDHTLRVAANVNFIDDTRYATIVIDGKELKTYLFSWYKNRGCTEVALLNGQELTEDQYIELLNDLTKVGYEWDNNLPLIVV